MKKNIFKSFDDFVLRLININMSNRIFDQFFTRFTNFGGGFFISFFTAFLFIFPKSRYVKSFAIEVAVAQIITALTVHTIKFLAKRLRPYDVLEWLNTFDISLRDYSFPSGHTAAAFSMAVVGSAYFPALSLIFYIFAVLIGISRMYLAVHFPTDVLVGGITGAIMSNISKFYLGPVFVGLIIG